MKLSAKIFTTILLSFLAIIILHYYLTTTASFNYLAEAFRQHAVNDIEVTVDGIRQSISAKEKKLKFFASISHLDQEKNIESKVAVHKLLQDVATFSQISVINNTGQQWLRLKKFPPVKMEQKAPSMFSSPIYQRPMLELETYLGSIQRIKGYQLPFINMSIPLRDRMTGKVDGVLWAQISFQEIQSLLESHLNKQSKVMLVQVENGDVLASADDTRNDFSALEHDAIADVLHQQERKGVLEKQKDNLKVTFIYRVFKLDNIEFILLYYQANDQIYSLANKLKSYNNFITLSGIILFTIVSFFLVRNIITPLHVLTNKIYRLSLQYRPKSDEQHNEKSFDKGDEVAQLGRAFDSFEKQLFIYNEEIESFNQSLEQKVSLKTKELKQELHERIRTEDALAAEKERLAITLRSIGDGVVTTDTDGNIVLVNKVAEKLTGWSQEDAIGKPITEVFNIIHEKTRKPCENPVEKVLESGLVIGLANHTTLIAKDGTERNIADSGAPIRDRESKIIGVVLVFRDVTEEYRTEQELLKVKKLESLGVLAGGIAHDFNNILVAILGNISLALTRCNAHDKNHKLLLNAEKATIRAKDLTQQLLTFSKGGEPVKEVTSIIEVIKDSANFILRGSKSRCDYSFANDIWPVEIDTGQISQVIQNIILNARHAMPEGGTVAVSCENHSADAFSIISKGIFVKIGIHDDGVGMPESVIDKIFDPYYSTKQKGSGLGLAITHSIISKHDGHIFVESSPGVGTTFTIYLPASKHIITKSSELIKFNNKKSRMNVLLMDDDDMVLDVAETLLEELGHDTVPSRNGKEAIRLYQESINKNDKYDLVLMDLTIPGGMGGKEAVQEILKLDPNAKVIVSSGYSNDPIMAHCKDYGFCAAIVKPYQIQELSKAFEEIFV